VPRPVQSLMSRIYASLPLRGPAGRLGRDVALGAELALEIRNDPTVDLALLDAFADDRETQAVKRKPLRTSDPRRTEDRPNRGGRMTPRRARVGRHAGVAGRAKRGAPHHLGRHR